MSDGDSYIKLDTIAFNVVYSLSGLATIIFGVIFLVKVKNVAEILEIRALVLLYSLIGVGAILCIVAYFEKTSWLVSALWGIVIMKCVVASTAFTLMETDEGMIRRPYSEEFEKCLRHSDACNFINSTELEYECCGMTNLSDWKQPNRTEMPSCSFHADEIANKSSSQPDGCLGKIIQHFHKIGIIVGVFVIGIIVVDLIGIIMIPRKIAATENDAERRGNNVIELRSTLSFHFGRDSPPYERF